MTDERGLEGCRAWPPMSPKERTFASLSGLKYTDSLVLSVPSTRRPETLQQGGGDELTPFSLYLILPQPSSPLPRS